jgi:hypothetical protein
MWRCIYIILYEYAGVPLKRREFYVQNIRRHVPIGKYFLDLKVSWKVNIANLDSKISRKINITELDLKVSRSVNIRNYIFYHVADCQRRLYFIYKKLLFYGCKYMINPYSDNVENMVSS